MNKTLGISIIAALALSTLGLAIWVKSSRDRIAELERAIGPYQVLQMDLGNASPEDVVEAFKSMEDSLVQMQMMYDTLSTDNAEMMSRIEEQKAQISALIQKAKNRDYDIKKLVAETQTLRNIMKGYIHQIDSLQQANDRLYAESQDAKQKASDAENRSRELESDLSQTKEQVKTGAVLSTGDFVNTGIRERVSGAETTTDRASRASMIKSTFTLRENKLAKPGRKTIYMKVVDASGKVVSGKGGGAFTSSTGADTFSASREIDYQNSDTDISIYFTPNGSLSKGVYKIELYESGNVIGRTEIYLK